MTDNNPGNSINSTPTTAETQPLLHIVLFQPEIPQNTGNIGRTCVALGIKLWLVRPLGFRVDSSQLKRSGMDYWNDLDWEVVENWDRLCQRLSGKRFWLFTKFANRSYADVSYRRGDVLVFGNESSGLPQYVHDQFPDTRIVLPMPGPVRCLNLATTAGIAAYEAARQLDGFSL